MVEVTDGLFNEDNPAALIAVAPPSFVPVLRSLQADLPKMFFRNDTELRRMIKPDERDDRLRIAFWDEYQAATAVGKRMAVSAFLRVAAVDIIVWEGFYLHEREKLLWIITQPKSYANAMKQILYRGIERFQEIMELKFEDEKGKLDSRALGQFLKAFQLVDLRVKGSIMQKVQIEQRNLNLNAEISNAQMDHEMAKLANMSLSELEELDQKLEKAKMIEAKMMRALPETDREAILDIKAEINSPTPTFNAPDVYEEDVIGKAIEKNTTLPK